MIAEPAVRVLPASTVKVPAVTVTPAAGKILRLTACARTESIVGVPPVTVSVAGLAAPAPVVIASPELADPLMVPAAIVKAPLPFSVTGPKYCVPAPFTVRSLPLPTVVVPVMFSS